MRQFAFLVHGFAGKKGLMREIESSLQENPYDQVYDRVANLSFYSSSYGLDLSQLYDLKTPIYDKSTNRTLAHYLLEQIIAEVETYQRDISLDIYAHSMGGLVTRAMVKYLLEDNKENETWIKNGVIRNIFLLGTPNHGTRLAQRAINIPADLCVTGLNIMLELPRGRMSSKDWQILNSQFMQMIPNSSFLEQLNERSKDIEQSINWVTIRGLKSTGLLGIAWQPFLFRKFHFDRHFPFLHIGLIPNDGVVNANSVPLKYATNLTIPNATHMDLLKWKTKSAGREVKEILHSITLAKQ
ncbi:MAG: esterase/lipase family protein [Candidatus Hodarchaeales archaeon]|jgi:triacylglycerol esterase/lipase EstA (alpha/beta hydrolase family)